MFKWRFTIHPIQLSDIEYDTFLKLSGNLNSDEATKKLCLQYYLEYKTVLYEEKQQSLSEDKVQIIMRCAFFLSEKSQHMYNLRVGIVDNERARRSGASV